MSKIQELRQRINEARRGVFSEVGNALDQLITTSEGSSISGQRDVELANVQDGQAIIWSAAQQKWVNGIPFPGSGEFQPVSQVLSAFSLIESAEGLVYQSPLGEYHTLPVEDFAEADHHHNAQYSNINHNHDSDYADIAHNHDLAYAFKVHYHDDIYSPISHNHDAFYITVISGPNAGNFPTITAGGELQNSSYGPSSFAAAVHNHDAVYVPRTVAINTTNSLTGGGDLTQSRTLSLVGDTGSPPANYVYGTNSLGQKTWKPDPVGEGGGGTITGIVGVQTLSALRSTAQSGGNATVILRGHTNPGDGGGGVFNWDAASTATDDNGTILVGPGGSGVAGRWIRSIEGPGDIRWFGAREDQAASTAISDAFKAMYAGRFSVLIIPKGTWMLNTSISEDMRDNTHVVAYGATFAPYQSTMGSIRLYGDGNVSPITKSVVSGSSRGSMKLVLDNVTGIAVHDLIEIKNNQDFAQNNTIAASTLKLVEVHSIRAIDPAINTIWLEAPMIENITDSLNVNGVITTGNPVTAVITKAAKNCTWSGGTWNGNGIQDTGLEFNYFYDVKLSDVYIFDTRGANIRISRTAYSKITNCHIAEHGNLPHPDSGYGGDGTWPGYGFMHVYSCYAKVINCSAGRGWHAFETAIGVRDIEYTSCTVHSNTWGFNNHQGVLRMTLNNCVSEGKLGIQGSATEIYINGGVFVGQAFNFSQQRPNILRVVGATCYAAGTATISYIGSTNVVGYTNRLMEWQNCTFYGENTTANLGSAKVDQVIVKDCVFYDSIMGVSFKYAHITGCSFHGANSSGPVMNLTGDSTMTGPDKPTAFMSDIYLRRNLPYAIVGNNHALHISNSFFAYASGHLFRNTGAVNSDSVHVYLSNTTINSPTNVVRNATVKIIKNCIALTGTAFTAGTDGLISAQENNKFMAV